jgi:hypothetical protein
MRAILRIDVHPTAAVGNDVDTITQFQRIQYGKFHAIIGGEPHDG